MFLYHHELDEGLLPLLDARQVGGDAGVQTLAVEVVQQDGDGGGLGT